MLSFGPGGGHGLEGLAGGGKDCGIAGRSLPAANRAIDVARIELEPRCAPARDLGCEDCGAAAEEGIEDEAVALGAILDGIGDERDGLHRRVHGERRVASGAEGIEAGIGPHVGASAAMLAELEAVDVRPVADLEHRDQLVLRAIEGAHPGVGLHPDAQVLERELRRAARCQELVEMTPVHAHEGDGAIAAVASAIRLEDGREEGRERCVRHLPRGHRELGVLHVPETRDVPADGDVIRRVREHHLRLLALQQTDIRVFLGCIGAQDAVIAELPEVSRPRDHRSFGLRRRELIERIGLARHRLVANDEVDLGDLEAGDGEVELGRELEQRLELDGQDLFIPARLLGEPVVGDHVGALLGLAHVREADGRHLAHAEQLCGLDAAVAGDDDGRLRR